MLAQGHVGTGMSRHARSDRSTSGAKAPRHARREDRQAPGPTRRQHPWPVQHRAPPVGDHTPTPWRPQGPLSHRAPPVGDHPSLCTTHWRHPSPYSTRYQPQTTLPVLSHPTSCHLKTEQHPPLIFFGTPNPIAPHNLLCPQRFQQTHVGTMIAKYYAEIVSGLQHSS